MSIDHGAVLRFLAQGHSQVEAAAFFGCSDRTIRNIKAAAKAREDTSTPGEHTSTAPQIESTTAGIVGTGEPCRKYTPLPVTLVAGSSTHWRDAAGELVKVPPGMTGGEWNALHLTPRSVELRSAPPEAVKVRPEAEQETGSLPVPESPVQIPEPEAVPLSPLAELHNPTWVHLREMERERAVRASAGRSAPPSLVSPAAVLGRFLGRLLAPGPELATLVAVLLVLMVIYRHQLGL